MRVVVVGRVFVLFVRLCAYREGEERKMMEGSQDFIINVSLTERQEGTRMGE